METAPDASLPATVGPYRVVGRLAMGGMAELLMGRRVGPSGFTRTVAVKRILPHLASDEDFRNMFLDEARLAAMIQHPNVVRVEDLGQDGASYYMAMELLEGDTVASLQRALAEPLEPDLAAYVVAECAAGLHAAHTLTDAEGRSLDVVHRDVTPHNVFVTLDGRVKLIDFGVARAAQRITTTQSGVIKGKFAYMSPEQLRDQRVDHRSDQFSLGVVLFELLTRRRLFARSNQGATVHAVVSEEAPPPSTLRPGLPPALDAICQRALAKRPEERFADCDAMRAALNESLGTSTGEARVRERLAGLMTLSFPEARGRASSSGQLVGEASSAATGPSIHPRPKPRRPLWIALGIALAIGAAAGLFFARSDDPEAPVVAAPAPIFVEISSDPPGAHIAMPGVTDAVTPARLERAPSVVPVSVELTLPGHEPWSRTLTLDVSQRVHATLATSPLAAVPREEAGASAAPEADPAAEEENAAAARAAEENADDAVRTDPADEARPRRRGRRREGADTAIPLWD